MDDCKEFIPCFSANIRAHDLRKNFLHYTNEPYRIPELYMMGSLFFAQSKK